MKRQTGERTRYTADWNAPVTRRSELRFRGGHIETISRDSQGQGQLTLNPKQYVFGFVFAEGKGRSLTRVAGNILRDVALTSEFSRYMNALPPGADVVSQYDREAGEAEYLLLCLDQDFVQRAGGGFQDLPSLAPFYGPGDPLAWQLARTLEDECRHGGLRGSLFAEQVATLMSHHVLRSNTALHGRLQDVPTGGLAPYKLKRVQDYIEDRITDEVSLAELSAMVGLSAHHFCRAFRQSTGLPPHRWQMQQRVKRAQDLMLEGDLSLANIAAAAGFSDQSHFTTVFRKTIGVTPNRWRRLMRG